MEISLEIQQLINLLPPEQKDVITLRHINGLSFKVIAERTGVSINTALGRMRFALVNLRQLMEDGNIRTITDEYKVEVIEDKNRKIEGEPSGQHREIIINDITIINKEWSKILKQTPDFIYKLTPRQFEEYIAELWYNMGYQITLTPETRDGGKDIYAYKKDLDGEILYAIECKKYAKDNKVGRPIIQQLYGVVESEKLTGGIIATTSYFTPDAIKYAESLKYRIFLHDIQTLNKFLSNL